jgi:hypothetical protein
MKLPSVSNFYALQSLIVRLAGVTGRDDDIVPGFCQLPGE